MTSTQMDREVARLMSEGQSAARRGDKPMARALLAQLVEQDPHSEEAWLWLSGVVDNPAEQQICLENVLVINPANAQARKGLEYLVNATGVTSRFVSAAPTRMAAPAAPPPPAPVPTPAAAPASALSDGLGSPVAPWEPSDFTTALDGDATEAAAAAVAAASAVTSAAPQWAQEEPAAALGTSAGVAEGRTGRSVPWDQTNTDLAAEVPLPERHEPAQAATSAQAPQQVPSTAADVPGAESAPPVAAEAEPAWFTDMSAPGAPLAFDPYDMSVMNSTVPVPEKDGADGDMPDWLENLTPSVSLQEPQGNGQFGHQFDAHAQDHSVMYGAQGMMGGMANAPAPTGGPAAAPGESPGPMGLYADFQLPSPDQLPGAGDDVSGPSAQPWYLQTSSGTPNGSNPQFLESSMLSSTALNSSALDDARSRKVASIECPNCKEQVPETSLACPECRFSFFVNCPHCHELVDTSDAKPGQEDTCPYCKQSIDKLKMGRGGVADLVSMKDPASRPALSGPAPDFPAMTHLVEPLPVKKPVSFGWVVDLLWLFAIVAVIWALTQLPTWLHLSGQF